MKNKKAHISILEEEMAAFFAGKLLKVYVDATIGAGGHAQRILQEHPEIEQFIGIDQDPEALAIAATALQPWKEKVRLVHANFSELDQVLQNVGISCVDGFFLTLGFHQCSWIKSIRGLVF